MEKIIKLNQQNLPLLAKRLKVPAYDRSKIKSGIVHIGVGGFHRAHEAFYTNQLLEKGDVDWGICGVALLPHDRRIYDTLRQQDGLYTLMVRQKDGSLNAQVIGSISEILFAPDDPQVVINKIASKEIKLITMTITEGGYNFDSATGEFIAENPSVQWDISHPQSPKTVFGYLSQALKIRQENNLPVTIQSCDNIQHNGNICKKMLLSFIKSQEPELVDWVTRNVSFPNSMVDRITPVTQAQDIGDLRQTFGIEDGWPVISESFHQWVIEDDYKVGRPAWENVGAQFVKDVHAYEEMKLRILNAGHSLVGLTGVLAGYNYIDEAVNDHQIHQLLSEYVDQEVIPTMAPVPGIDLQDYKEAVIHRFGNPFIKDTVGRIIGESAAKLPKFVLPTVLANLKKGAAGQKGILILAAWYVYLKKMVDEQKQDEIEDSQKNSFLPEVHSGAEAFVKFNPVFGDISTNEQFLKTYLLLVKSIQSSGILKTIEGVIQEKITSI